MTGSLILLLLGFELPNELQALLLLGGRERRRQGLQTGQGMLFENGGCGGAVELFTGVGLLPGLDLLPLLLRGLLEFEPVGLGGVDHFPHLRGEGARRHVRLRPGRAHASGQAQGQHNQAQRAT
jgi:hypothetical protein